MLYVGLNLNENIKTITINFRNIFWSNVSLQLETLTYPELVIDRLVNIYGYPTCTILITISYLVDSVIVWLVKQVRHL